MNDPQPDRARRIREMTNHQKWQRENLRKAAVALRERADEIRPHFNMRIFADKPEPANYTGRRLISPWDALPVIANNYSCGAQGCLIGLTPWLIGEMPNQLDGTWYGYCRRVYGINPVEDDSTWSWLFSSDWSRRDNTPEGAAARTEHFLEHGLPENWYDQMIGSAPLCYENHLNETDGWNANTGTEEQSVQGHQ